MVRGAANSGAGTEGTGVPLEKNGGGTEDGEIRNVGILEW